MGMTMTGVNVKGIRIIGSEFLEPTQITNCVSWLKWQTGITSSGGKFIEWLDQVPGRPSGIVTGMSTSRRPNYDVATGKISGDGVDDFFYRENGNDTNVASQEWWLVGGRGVVGSPDWNMFSWMRNDGADGDAFMLKCNSDGYFQRSVAVGTGALMQSLSQFTLASMPATFKFIIAVTCGAGSDGRFFYNGVETAYSIKSNFPMIAIAGTSRRQYFLAQGVNTLTAINCGTVPIYEFAHFTKRLSVLERTKLANYFKQKHLIL